LGKKTLEAESLKKPWSWSAQKSNVALDLARTWRFLVKAVAKG
jgi:hypothetical protein